MTREETVKLINNTLLALPAVVADCRADVPGAIGYLRGKIAQYSRGKAIPRIVNQELDRILLEDYGVVRKRRKAKRT